MDNVTHTLIGVLVGETAARFASPSNSGLPERSRRNVGVTLMAFGSNLPDGDFLYSAITGNKLDYLLQHRGYTHTVVGALLAAMFLFAVAEAWLRFRRLQPSRADRFYLAGLALLGPLLHVAMDFTNSYGVHPFWPIYNGWLYGDAVFIIEPLFWAAAAPLVFLLRSRLARALVAVVLAAAVALSFGTGLVPIPFAIVLTLVVIGLLSVGRYTSPRTALISGVVVWCGVTGGFFAMSSVAEKRVDTLLSKHFPAATTLDRVLTPMPVDPVCWEVISAQTKDDLYIIRKGMLSLFPAWVPANRCPERGMNARTTAPLVKVNVPDTRQMRWFGEMTLPRDRLKGLAAISCEVAALLRFARVPWALQREAGWIAGDLRYDREPELGFSEIEVTAAGEKCPAVIPPWSPPRSDLLTLRSEE